jgi:predicted secreted acid phosphatase
MKRLQNIEFVDEDDKNDIEEMKNMEYHGENEDHVLITMENNPNKKAKEEKIKRMLIKVMAIHEALAKNFFESNLNQKTTTLPSHIS